MHAQKTPFIVAEHHTLSFNTMSFSSGSHQSCCWNFESIRRKSLQWALSQRPRFYYNFVAAFSVCPRGQWWSRDRSLRVPDDLGRSAVLGWASAVGGVLAYQWSKPIPTSLKIIHARVYAQVCSQGAVASTHTHTHSVRNVALQGPLT